MKKLLFLVLLLTTQIAILADPDSLLTKLEKAKAENDIHALVDIYQKLALQYDGISEYHTALFYLDTGLELVTEKEDSAKYLRTFGKVFVDSTDYDSALKYLKQSLRICEEIEALEEISSVHGLMGMCYGLTNNLDQAEIEFRNALEANKVINDSSGVAVNFYNIGLVNYFKGLYDKAIENYIESLKIRELLTDTTAIVTSITSIGETFRIRDDNENAMLYYQKALKYRDAIKNNETLAYLFSEIGLIYKNNKQYDNALAYFDTAMVYSKKCKYKRGIATLYTYIGNIEKEIGNLNKAQDLHLKAIDEYKAINFEIGIVQSSIVIAEIYFDRKNYSASMNLINGVEGKAVSNNLLDEQSKVAELKYKIYKVRNNQTAALKALEKYNALKDSLYNLDKEKQIEEIKTKYETEKKEQQIEILDQETKIQQQQIESQKYLIIGSVAFLVLALSIALLYVKQNKLKSRLAVEQSKLQLLRSQMNPHFIYNSLTAIQNFILQNNSIESVSYIGEFSALMRLVLEGSRNDFVPLEDDIALVDYYLKMQKLRFPNVFDYKISKGDSINEEAMQLPPMLTQPFIENAVEHGMRSKENGDGEINVEFHYEKPNLKITITDNGPGIGSTEDSEEKSHTSLATKITRERISNIERLFKVKIGFEITSPSSENGTGTCVVFTIPQYGVDND